MSLWGIRPDFSGLSPCYRQIAYVLLTRAPVAAKSIATSALPLDLHVLGLSLAFILSQDQTLRCISVFSFLYLQSDSRPKLTSFFLLYYTCFFSVLSMNFISPPSRTLVGPFPAAKVLQRYTLFLFPSKFLNNFFSKIFQKNRSIHTTFLFTDCYKQCCVLTFFYAKAPPVLLGGALA